MAVGANDNQIHAAICGKRQDDIGDRRPSRRHLLNVDIGTVTREEQGNVSAGFFTVSIACFVSVDNQERHGLRRHE